MEEDPKEEVRVEMPKSEVVAKAKRRQYIGEYKLRILREVDACQGSDNIGALLRREGLYSSNLTNWRRQHERGELNGLSPQKRGPKLDPPAVELARLKRENERLREQLRKTEMIIDVQKKLLRCSARRSKEPTQTNRTDPVGRAVG